MAISPTATITPDNEHGAALALQAGADLSCSIWAPGFNTLADAVRQGLVSEHIVTAAAERLFTARIQLGFFDPQGEARLISIPFSADASEENRKLALNAAEEAMALLKNNGVLPHQAPHNIAVVGPTADLLVSSGRQLQRAYRVHPVSPLDGITQQFPLDAIHYAQGSTLANGVSVPVPRTAFGAGHAQTEFFATPDWTGRPVPRSNRARDSI